MQSSGWSSTVVTWVTVFGYVALCGMLWISR